MFVGFFQWESGIYHILSVTKVNFCPFHVLINILKCAFLLIIYSRSYEYVPLPHRYRFEPYVTDRYRFRANVTQRYLPLLAVTEFYCYLRYKRYQS